MIALMTRIAEFIGAINRPIGRSGCAAAGAILAAMTLIVMAQVISRYVFNNSIGWTEELSKSLMVWTAFLVAPWAWREGANVSIALLAEALPGRIQAILRIAITLLTLWIVAVFLGEGFAFAMRGMANRMATLPIASGVFYLVIPISLSAMILVGIELLLRDVIALISGHNDHPALAIKPIERG